MITHVIINKEQGKTFATFFINEETAEHNMLFLSKVRSKSLFTFNEFLNVENEIFVLDGKKYKSVKGLLKAELHYVSKNYPQDLKDYSNVIALFN
jgi:hypothetical protein